MNIYGMDGNRYRHRSDTSHRSIIEPVVKLIASIQVPDSEAEKFQLLKSLSRVQQAIDAIAEKLMEEKE